MNPNHLTRRQFVGMASAGSVGAVVSHSVPALGNITKQTGKLAILGGDPIRKNKQWPSWPYWDDKVVFITDSTTLSSQ